MEAGELAIYMFCVCAFATLLQHPDSPVRKAVLNDLSRRAIMGVAMGATVVATVMSPWGKQSGGHFNPAITFSFYRLGKVSFWDAFFYGIAQFFGAIAGVAIASCALRGAPANHAVRYAATVPGAHGRAVAFTAELAISFVLMITILCVSNRKTLARYTPYFVGGLYATFITFETPLSGMSMNPARTFGSALHGYWQALWVYFTGPILGMLVAGEVFLRARGGVPPFCAKLHHANNKRCIFHHGNGTAPATISGSGDNSMKKWKRVILTVFILLVVAWNAFRPERLVSNKRVHEEFRITQNGSPAQSLESGKFHGVAHPTQGSASINFGTAALNPDQKMSRE